MNTAIKNCVFVACVGLSLASILVLVGQVFVEKETDWPKLTVELSNFSIGDLCVIQFDSLNGAGKRKDGFYAIEREGVLHFPKELLGLKGTTDLVLIDNHGNRMDNQIDLSIFSVDGKTRAEIKKK